MRSQTRLRSALLIMVWAGGSASAGAQAIPPATSSVQEVVVVAPKDPKVLSTFPADGAKVPGGPLILKIVFDQPMTAGAWSYTHAEGGRFPGCLAKPRLLNDRKTFALLCSLAINTAFALEVNAAPEFVSTAGRSAKPFQLHFTTTDETTNDLDDALTQSGLTAADDPIMSPDEATGSMQSAAPPKPVTPPDS